MLRNIIFVAIQWFWKDWSNSATIGTVLKMCFKWLWSVGFIGTGNTGISDRNIRSMWLRLTHTFKHTQTLIAYPLIHCLHFLWTNKHTRTHARRSEATIADTHTHTCNDICKYIPRTSGAEWPKLELPRQSRSHVLVWRKYKQKSLCWCYHVCSGLCAHNLWQQTFFPRIDSFLEGIWYSKNDCRSSIRCFFREYVWRICDVVRLSINKQNQLGDETKDEEREYAEAKEDRGRN